MSVSLALELLLIPAFLFTWGILLSYEVRKLFARMQARYGPLLLMYSGLRGLLGTSRILQPLYDVLKLWYKETIIPATANKLWFELSPYMGLFFALVATLLVPVAGISPLAGHGFSVVILLYLLAGTTVMWILGSAASSSAWGAIGARREAEMMLGYEIALAMSAFSACVMTRSLSLADISEYRIPILLLNPLAAISMMMAILGKLHMKPFDIPEAEVEIVAGPFTEYSGRLLSVVEATKLLQISTMVALFVDLFLRGGLLSFTGRVGALANAIAFLSLCAAVTFVITLIHTLMPRYRVDQGLLWFIKYAWPTAVAGLVWSIALTQWRLVP